MRVLVVNHTGAVSGGERSLLDLLGALPTRIGIVAACPEGPLGTELRNMGVPTLLLPDASMSLRLDLRHTPRGIAATGLAAQAVARQARRMGATVVYANSVRAGMIASAASLLGAPRPVVHIRDCLPESATGRAVRRLVNARAAALVANSAYTARAWGNSRTPVRVALGPVDMARFDPARHDRNAARVALGLAKGDAPVLAVLGQLTPWKGQDLAIQAVAALHRDRPGVVLLVAGEVVFGGTGTRHDNTAYATNLRSLARDEGVEDAVRFTGSVDAAGLLAASDVLLVPSWEEPMGRVVLEGLAMGVPVAATNRGGPAELLDGVAGGVLLPPRRADIWVSAIERLLDDHSLYKPAARAARRRAAEAHDAGHHVEIVVDVWNRTLSGRQPTC